MIERKITFAEMRVRGAVCLTYVKTPAHHRRSLFNGSQEPPSVARTRPRLT